MSIFLHKNNFFQEQWQGCFPFRGMGVGLVLVVKVMLKFNTKPGYGIKKMSKLYHLCLSFPKQGYISPRSTNCTQVFSIH